MNAEEKIKECLLNVCESLNLNLTQFWNDGFRVCWVISFRYNYKKYSTSSYITLDELTDARIHHLETNLVSLMSKAIKGIEDES